MFIATNLASQAEKQDLENAFKDLDADGNGVLT